ncbi:coiled-coil domain-containing protein [Flavilitoribacter nigricans]|uniref:Uncharacterized protein n=1 Tax=Flavilitoribacter nigricans (strain ATCC 23147 / DSM 23189 / NBRC 102662 / NCIMB 1420 / SS-2) TaxID=1122177 RepID=A0A2D0NHH1_FLAN2|nr:hypothetical protein [Flavilitoribacter nigricans]PHN07836.1 hypothetical protein CRP01_03540 [Flavilitoribacter nigricans DSM 23189 = NBRC 102662]
MRNFLMAVILIFAPIILAAQDLHIYYDVYKDSIFYKKNGQTVERAQLKKGANAVLHIVNYNDYIYDVMVSTESENYEIPSSGMGKMFGGGGMGDAFRELGDAAGNFGISGFGLEANSLTDEREGAVEYESTVSLEAIRLSKRFETVLEDMADIENDIEELGEDIEEKIQNQQFASFKKDQVYQLRTNPNLSANMIKKISMDYMEQVLDIERGEDFDLEKLFEKSDPKKVIGSTVKDYKTETTRLEGKFAELSSIAQLLFAFEMPGTDKATFESAFTRAAQRQEAYQEKVATMEAQINDIQKLDIQEFADLRYIYEEMKDHRFEKTITLKPEDDLTKIKINLVPVDSALIKGLKPKSLSNLEVETFGGLKINASVGISFAGFFKRPQKYYARDGRIFADDLDSFTPIITSFIHFHPQSKKQVSLGGAFGIGIGLGTENSGLQNYFLGPSIIVGKRQRIVFTTGFMTGKLNRISQGYQVGDAYDQDLIPTKSVYELGGFLGISFNFMGG